MRKWFYFSVMRLLKKHNASKAYMWAYRNAMKLYIESEDDPLLGYFAFSHDYFKNSEP